MPKILVWKVRRSWSSVMSRMSLSGCCSPALLTRMSSPPSCVDRLLHRLSQNSLSPMSPAIVIALRPFLLDDLLRLRRIVMLAQIEDGDVGALAGEQRRDRAADAAVGAGDQRDLALEAIRTLVARLPVGLGLELALVAGQLILVDHRLHDVGFVAHGSLLGRDAHVLALELVRGRLVDRCRYRACLPRRPRGIFALRALGGGLLHAFGTASAALGSGAQLAARACRAGFSVGLGRLGLGRAGTGARASG